METKAGDGDEEGGRDEDGSRLKAEKVCRICHFGKGMQLIQLGCDCKGELGSSHKHCAKAWFTQKGLDRLCEICGKTAKNIKDDAEERSIFMMEWAEMRVVAATLDASPETTRTCKRCFCGVVFTLSIILFMLMWFFRGINIL